ncbi:hypothetical protein [Klebsiella phage MY01]|nr:hypothetical protein [Pseudomonas phage MY01]
MITHCENLGYIEGMKFIVCDDNDNFDSNDEIWLHEDDGSDCPEFRDAESADDYDTTEYLALRNVAPVIDGKTPAQARGFKPGDIFILNRDDEGEEADEGTILTLVRDDGSICPVFEFVNRDGDQVSGYFYLGQLNYLEPKVGRKVRVIHNRTGGHDSGSEGIIRDIDSDSLEITCNGTTFYHSVESCVVYGYSADEAHPDNPNDTGLKCKVTWPTKPADQWKEGDKGIVHGQQIRDEHNIAIGDVVTFLGERDSERGFFKSENYPRKQNIDYRLIEPIEAAQKIQIAIIGVDKEQPVACIKAIRSISDLGLYESKQTYEQVRDGVPATINTTKPLEEVSKVFGEAGITFFKGETLPKAEPQSELVFVSDSLSELKQTSTKYTYFIEGDSIKVTLVGYFEGEPICAYKDRWGDTQTFVAKQSLLVPSDD